MKLLTLLALPALGALLERMGIIYSYDGIYGTSSIPGVAGTYKTAGNSGTVGTLCGRDLTAGVVGAMPAHQAQHSAVTGARLAQ